MPPHNVEAERAALGAVLIEGADALAQLRASLLADDFFHPPHRTVYSAMLALEDAGASIDALTVSDLLRERGQLHDVGGQAYLALLLDEGSIAAHLQEYVRIVLRDAGKRQGIQALMRGLEHAYNTTAPTELASTVGEELAKIAERTDAEAFRQSAQRVPTLVPLHDVLEIAALNLRFDVPDLVPSPVQALNERFGGGFKRKELILLGGGPGVAKSALMGWWARYAAQPEHGGHLVAIASLEMANDDIGQRIIADAAQVSATALRKQNLEDDEWTRIERSVPTFKGLPVGLCDEITHIRQLGRMLRRRAEHREPPVRLLIVDYLQLLEGPPAAARYQEVGQIAKLLKRIAKRFDCTVLALSSITPDPPQKGKKATRQAPTMRNLRESRDLDHAADVILMLWQPDPTNSTRELIIDKGRNGAAEGFRIRLQFTPMYQRFMEE